MGRQQLTRWAVMMTKCGGAWQGWAHSDSEGTDMPGVAQGLWWDDGGPCVVVSQQRWWQGQVRGAIILSVCVD